MFHIRLYHHPPSHFTLRFEHTKTYIFLFTTTISINDTNPYYLVMKGCIMKKDSLVSTDRLPHACIENEGGHIGQTHEVIHVLKAEKCLTTT